MEIGTSRSTCFWSVMAKINLMILLLFAVNFSSCLNNRVAEFALTKKEESDSNEPSKQELVEEEEELDAEDLEVFYPTNQWQTVRPGQAIPAGLHVQLNLQTGEKFAKLPDEDKDEKRDFKDPKKNKRLGHIDVDPSSFTTQELKKALAKMKKSLKTDNVLEEKAHQEDVKRKFRPIEKLKEEFRELNLQLETDFEIMFKLINKLNSSASTLEEKITALYDLEYYVHQVDNAKDLLSLGGLQLLINGLNSTEPLMKEYASFVLGAALSSNPRVQVAAIEGGTLQKLLVILATDQAQTVKKKVLAPPCKEEVIVG